MKRIFGIMLIFLISGILINNLEVRSAASGITEIFHVIESSENITVRTANYTAIIDKPYGNLKAVYDRNGYPILGGDGNIKGVVACWNDTVGSNHIQQDDGNCPDTRIELKGKSIVVSNAMFTEVYTFHENRIGVEVKVTGSDLLLGDDFHVFAASVQELSRDVTLQDTYEDYIRWNGYPTDYTTDIAQGQWGLWNTNIYTGDVSHIYRITVSKPAIEGLGKWYMRSGVLWFEKGENHSVPSGLAAARYQEKIAIHNNSDLEAYSVVVATANHQVIQSFDYLKNGDVLHFYIMLNNKGYRAYQVKYPVSTRTYLRNDGTADAKLLVPWEKPEGGYKVFIALFGHWGTMWSNTFQFDFLANEGYIVAAPNCLSGSGEVHNVHDWGYFQQREIEDLRIWLMNRFDINPEKVFVGGISKGGMNALLAGVNHPEAYAGIITYSGVYNTTLWGLTSAWALMCYPLRIELVPATGGTPLDYPYEYAIRSASYRYENFGDRMIFAVHGQGDHVVYFTDAEMLARDCPQTEYYIIPEKQHEMDVFLAYRKEMFNALERSNLSNELMNNVNAVFYGKPDYESKGYEPTKGLLNYSNEWLKVELPDKAFTTINASRIVDGYKFKADRDVKVYLKLPGKNYSFNVSGTTDAVMENETFFGKTYPCITFDAKANQEYSVSYKPIPPPPPLLPPKEKTRGFIPGFQALALITALIAMLAVMRYRIVR